MNGIQSADNHSADKKNRVCLKQLTFSQLICAILSQKANNKCVQDIRHAFRSTFFGVRMYYAMYLSIDGTTYNNKPSFDNFHGNIYN